MIKRIPIELVAGVVVIALGITSPGFAQVPDHLKCYSGKVCVSEPGLCSTIHFCCSPCS